jgi:hypothetical protein
MIYRARERRSRRRVVLKAYLRQHRNPTRAAALEREQRMLRLAAPHAGIVALERVLEVGTRAKLQLTAGIDQFVANRRPACRVAGVCRPPWLWPLKMQQSRGTPQPRLVCGPEGAWARTHPFA